MIADLICRHCGASFRWATTAEQNRNKSNVYTAAEDAKIRDAISRGYNFRQMAEYVGRSAGSVTMRTYRLGLKSGQPLCSNGGTP